MKKCIKSNYLHLAPALINIQTHQIRHFENKFKNLLLYTFIFFKQQESYLPTISRIKIVKCVKFINRKIENKSFISTFLKINKINFAAKIMVTLV